MPVVQHEQVPREPFPNGATYQTLVGNAEGSTPVRIGIQTSPPGYKTPLHSHPYWEILTVLEGEGEGWIEGRDEMVPMAPGVTLVMPAHVRHYFRALGDRPLKTYGVHVSPHRIVIEHAE